MIQRVLVIISKKNDCPTCTITCTNLGYFFFLLSVFNLRHFWKNGKIWVI